MTKAFNPVPKQCTFRGRDRWEVDCRPWGPTMKQIGEPCRRRFANPDAALAWCQELIVARKMGRKVASPEEAVSAYCDRYFKSCERSQMAQTTVLLYGKVLIGSFVPFMRKIGCDYLDQLSPTQIEEYRQFIAATHAPRTVRTWIAILQSAFSWGVKLKLFDSNPVKGLVPPALKGDRRALTDEERTLILTEAKHRDVWLAYLLTGLRAFELAGLPAASVKVEHRGAAHLVVIGKGSKKRIVHLQGEGVDHFRMLLAAARERGDEMLLPFRTRTLQDKWSRERRRLGLPEVITIHAFRHTYGTFMAYKDLIGTQRAMGHSDIKTTMGYVHEDDRMIREASELWSAALHTDAQADGTELVSPPKKPKRGVGER